jgi:glycosyltransferase involved in cell wall biosynthesis
VNIVQLVSGKGVNGGIRHCLDLTCELARRGHRVLLVHTRGAWVASGPLPAGVESFETSFRRHVPEFRRVAAAFRAREIEVVHSHSSSAHFFSVLLSRAYGFPKVATCHMPFFQPHWWWNDRVIAPTPATARFQRWLNLVPARRIDVIPYFVEPARLRPARPRAVVRAELGVAADDFLILCAGKISARKNQALLVRALHALRRDGVPAVVALAGGVDERYRRTLDRALRETGFSAEVKLLGLRGDIPDLLAASDCFCLPSKREVMPVACWEAMAARVPLVVNDIGGLGELLRNEEQALIVPQGNEAALTAALRRLAADPDLRRRLTEAARRKIDEEYSADACVPRIVECYREARRQRSGLERVKGIEPSS